MSKARRRRALLRTVRYHLGLPRSGDRFNTMFTAGKLPSLTRRNDRVWLDSSAGKAWPWIWAPGR